MTIDEVIAVLQSERQNNVKSRFPGRAIMCANIAQYCELLSKLREIYGIQIVSGDIIFTGDDLMPEYSNLNKTFDGNEWIVLTGVSEYLRLFSKKELSEPRFGNLWKNMSSSFCSGRIIVPLWGCKAQWFDQALSLNSDERQREFFYDCTDSASIEQKMTVRVVSKEFESYLAELITPQTVVLRDLRKWFDYWSNPNLEATDFVLLTNRCQNIYTVDGDITVSVLSNAQSFISQNMKGANILNGENCTAEMQNILFGYAIKGGSFEEALLKEFNATAFDGVEIMGKWRSFDDSKKRFVKLWYETHPDNTYLNHCFKTVKNVSNALNHITSEIFNVYKQNPQWIAEYQKLAEVLSFEPNKKVFEALDQIDEYDQQLEFVFGKSRQERIYILHMVGKWLRDNRAQVLSSSRLNAVYPELCAYLNTEATGIDEDLNDYMLRYKMHKLENTLPTDEDIFFSGINFESYDNRYTQIAENIDDDTVILWVDALGVEWLPLLEWSLRTKCDCKLQYSNVTQVCLPTETEFNNLWNKMDTPHQKLDKLDKLAHKGVVDEPDYYSCVQEQIEFVVNIHETVSGLLEKYHRVIITGDHGTSRLAARFFHARDGLDAPKNSKVCSHGRYCELLQSYSATIPNTIQRKADDGKNYLIFRNYDHFKISGYAAGGDDETAIYGEVHGGATPEEILVPVVVVDSKKEKPLNAEWEKSAVRAFAKKAKLILKFNRPVNALQVNADGIDATVSPTVDKAAWNVIFDGLRPGTHRVQTSVNNKLVPIPDITILPAISGDGDLP